MAVQRRNTRQRKLVLTPCAKAITIPTADDPQRRARADDKIQPQLWSTATSKIFLAGRRRDSLHQERQAAAASHRTVELAMRISSCTSCSRVIDVPPLRCPTRHQRASGANRFGASHLQLPTIFEGLALIAR